MQQVGNFEGCKALNIFSTTKASNTTEANLLRVMKEDAIQTIPRKKNREKCQRYFAVGHCFTSKLNPLINIQWYKQCP